MAKTQEPVSWPWWWSRDEERYRGPCSSRADAILEAWAEEPDSTAFHVMQAEHHELATAVFDGDQIAAAFDELNEEAADGDGDPLSDGLPHAEWSAIGETLSRRIAAAVRKHGVTAWRFARQTGGEWVDVSGALVADLPSRAKEVIGELAAVRAEGATLTEENVDRLLGELKAHLLEAPAPVGEGSPQ